MAAGIIMASDGLSGSMFETGLPAPYQGGGGLITADLDGDGRRDFLITRVGRIGAVGSSGARLWSKEVDIQLTSKAENEGLPGTHAPGVQAADIDGDGATEVLFLTRDGALNVVDGAPGAERAAVRLPAPPPAAERWEHLVVADFRGRGDRDQRPWVLDARGDVIASYEMADVAPKGWSVKGVEEIFTIHWTGGPEQLAAEGAAHQRRHRSVRSAERGLPVASRRRGGPAVRGGCQRRLARGDRRAERK
jgi:hypothetical protein